DAIVVVEAVQHYIDHDRLSAKEATRRAMKEITAPVIAIALILAAVFVPVGFIPGMVGQLYQQFAITIAVSVLLSAFVALSLTPALCALLLRPSQFNEKSTGINRLFYKFNVWFERVTKRYSHAVRATIKRAPLAIIILICIYVGTVGLFSTKPTGFIPTEDAGVFMMGVTLPEGASSKRTAELLDAVSDSLRRQTPEISNVMAISGINLLNRSFKPNGGTFFVQLTPWDARTRTAGEIVASLQIQYNGFQQASILPVMPPAIPGLGVSGGFSMQLIDQRNGDIKDFEAQVGKFLAAANQRPEIGMAYTLFNSNTPNYLVKVDREQAERMGVSVSSVYSAVSSCLGSSYVNDFARYGRNFRVVSQADTAFRMDINDINKLYVKNTQGNPVPLSALISHEIIESPSIINHFNIFRSIDLMGGAAPGYSSGDALQALEETAAQTLGAGFTYEFSGLSLQ